MAFCVYGLVIHSESIDDLKFLSKTAVVVDNGKVFTTLILLDKSFSVWEEPSYLEPI